PRARSALARHRRARTLVRRRSGTRCVTRARADPRAPRRACRPVPQTFPGHGSAPLDSHLALPDITACWREADELAPFASLCNNAPVAVMTAHLLHRGIDPEFPASLSRVWTTGVLRERLGFGGVIVTDSLDMRAAAQRWPCDQAAAIAVRAGADLALDANNMPGAPRSCPAPEMIRGLFRAIDHNELTPETLRAAARRVDALAAFTRPRPGALGAANASA